MKNNFNLNPIFSYIKRILNEYRNRIETEKYDYCTEIINSFELWYENNALSASDLYDLIICGEYDEGLYEYAECGADDEDTEIHYMWEVILSVLMTVVRIAYETEENPYYQQDMEAILKKYKIFMTLLKTIIKIQNRFLIISAKRFVIECHGNLFIKVLFENKQTDEKN